MTMPWAPRWLGPGLADSAIWPALAAAWLCSSGKRLAVQPQQPAAQRDGARGDDDDVAAVGLERGDIGGERRQPVGAQLAGLAIDQQGRADLDGQPPIGREASFGRDQACSALHRGRAI